MQLKQKVSENGNALEKYFKIVLEYSSVVE